MASSTGISTVRRPRSTLSWQQFKPEDSAREILNEQISIVLSTLRLHYDSADEVRFIRYFPGAKLKSGAFLLQTSRPNCKPIVLKFDSLANIAKEQARYKDCVKEYLAYTPGEPWMPRQQSGFIEGHPWGAIAYSFVGAGANPDDIDRLQPFDRYYLEHNEAQIEKALDNIFTALKPWWKMRRGWPQACRQKRQPTLYDEYNRLLRKQDEIKRSIRRLAKEIKGLEAISADNRYISLNRLKLRNPPHWVKDVFAAKKLGKWVDEYRQDSIVHGDFHSGNILISQDRKGEVIQAWLIDFPHTHIGPTAQDIARLEASIKFGLLPDDTLQSLGPEGIHKLETYLLPEPKQAEASLKPGGLTNQLQATPHLKKNWQAVNRLRGAAQAYMIGEDIRPYYLALLHATLPTLYYQDRGPWQRLYAFISAALLCARIGG